MTQPILKPETLNRLLGYEWDDQYCFYSYFQEGVKTDAQFLTINQLVIAFQNTKDRLKQSDCKPSTVAKWRQAIFETDRRLICDLTVQEIDGNYWLIGGRHRLYAIITAFDELIENGVDETDMYEQLLRVDLTVKEDFKHFERDIEADNESRHMTKAEKLGIRSQQYGADPNNPISCFNAAMTQNSVADITDLASKYFESQYADSEKIESGGRCNIGKIFAKYIIFGNQTMSKHTQPLVTKAEDFKEKADKLWQLVVEEIGDNTVVTRNAPTFAKAAIKRFEKEQK